MKDAADKLGVTTMVSTPATDLITKDGKVVGVVAKDAKGNTYTINSKAVILASGSFGDDPQKVKNGGIEILKAGRVPCLSTRPVTEL